MFGPFHRLESPTQTVVDASIIAGSGELWGAAPFGSDLPQVQAYVGPLPTGRRGIEFLTPVEPASGSPPGHAKWLLGAPGVMARERAGRDFASISVRVTRNDQS